MLSLFGLTWPEAIALLNNVCAVITQHQRRAGREHSARQNQTGQSVSIPTKRTIHSWVQLNPAMRAY